MLGFGHPFGFKFQVPQPEYPFAGLSGGMKLLPKLGKIHFLSHKAHHRPRPDAKGYKIMAVK